MLKNTKSDLWAACVRGRKIYNYQIVKTSDVKVKTLQHVLDRDFSEYLSFGNDFKAMASQLCDSKRFSSECERLELKPEVVAQHVVFEGAKTFTKVRNYGITAVFGTRLDLFNHPLV